MYPFFFLNWKVDCFADQQSNNFFSKSSFSWLSDWLCLTLSIHMSDVQWLATQLSPTSPTSARLTVLIKSRDSAPQDRTVNLDSLLTLWHFKIYIYSFRHYLYIFYRYFSIDIFSINLSSIFDIKNTNYCLVLLFRFKNIFLNIVRQNLYFDNNTIGVFCNNEFI